MGTTSSTGGWGWGFAGSDGSAPGASYAAKVLSTSPIAYWPLRETSGTTATCLVNSAQNGTYARNVSTMTTGTGIGDGGTAPLFDGSSDRVAIYSATLASAFNGAEGTVMAWVKASGASWWELGNEGTPVIIRVDGNNELYFEKDDNVTDELKFRYEAGGVQRGLLSGSLSTPLGWLCVVWTWSATADEAKAYVGGSQVSTTQTGLGVWAGSLTDNDGCMIGSDDGAAPSDVWSGYLAHVALWSSALSAATITTLASV